MPSYHIDDTIAAIATPVGEGGVSIVRVSGEKTFEIVSKIFISSKQADLNAFKSHTIHLGEIKNSKNEILDQVLVSIFRNPQSYTGEDVIEISSHGGMVVTNQILSLLFEQGVRHAEPGEFTRRAFLNGKIDLTQAEAVSDLIAAKSKRSADVALKQLSGSLSKKLFSMKSEMMKVYAHLEAYLDFPEEDIEVYANEEISERLKDVRQDIQKLIEGFGRATMMREGLKVVLVGKPNVGKSSLFNALLERDRALVSEMPGTTRDHLEEFLEIEGVCVRLIDTAGLGDLVGHPLDQMGIQRTHETLATADLYLFIAEGSSPLNEEDEKAFKSLKKDTPVIVVINKSDLKKQINEQQLEKISNKNTYVHLSAKSKEGFAELEKKMITEIFGEALEGGGEQITRVRHLKALEKSNLSLKACLLAFTEKKPLEIVVFELKASLGELQELIGEVYSEDLLDVIFSEFCIGK